MYKAMNRANFFGAALVVLATSAWGNPVLNITGAATYTDSTTNCSNPNGVWASCGVNAFVDTSYADMNSYFMNLSTFGGGSSLGEEGFRSAFAGGAPSWTLVNGGDLNLTLTVDQFNAEAFQGVAGINPIDIQVTNYVRGANDPTVDQLVWLQGLEINYRPGGGNAAYNTSTTYNTMDTYSFNQFNQAGGCTAIPASPNNTTPSNIPGGNHYCDPVYPFQYNDLHFYDAPLAPYPNGSFRGIALLGTVNTVTDTVTVYDGVSYGFDTWANVPEPGSLALLLVGAAVLAFAKRSTARGQNAV